MPSCKDGPSTDLFRPLPFKGNVALSGLSGAGISDEMSTNLEHAPSGDCIAWGIPFQIEDAVALGDQAVMVDLNPTTVQWLVFMHTSDRRQVKPTPDGFFSPMRGQGQLAEHAADYVVLYRDDTESRLPIRRRHQIGAFQRIWGENCFESVAHQKPRPVRAAQRVARFMSPVRAHTTERNTRPPSNGKPGIMLNSASHRFTVAK